MAASLSLLVSFFLFGSSIAAIPDAICSLSDPGFDNCMKASLNNLIPLWAAEGIKEVNMESLDPMVIRKLTLRPEGKRLKGKLTVRNVSIRGLNETKIATFTSDLNKAVDQTLILTVTNPKLMITGNYKGAVLVQGMNVTGDGEFKLKLGDIAAKAKVVADSVKGSDDKLYFTVKTVDINPKLGSLKVNATNLFDRNHVKANLVLEMVNSYWRSYYEKVMPEIKPHLQRLIKDKINEFTTKISTDRIIKS